MGRLIIDGNSVFEIDEECMKRRRPVPECDVEKYIHNEHKMFNQELYGDSAIRKSQRAPK